MRFALALLAVACSAAEVSAQGVLERIERDELAVIEESDPIMVAAIRKGRQTLPDFLKLSRAPGPSMSDFAVKVAVRAGDQFEYFWITNFENTDGQFSGRLDNIPRWAKHLKAGDIISFKQNEIVDWLYIQDGRMVGNFTFCALMQRENRREALAAIKRLRADCKR
jgi:uncharacterized protein YegJ (DUF2314 family)